MAPSSTRLRPALQMLLVTVAFWVCLSRVADYKHHPSDVLAGSVLGVAVAWMVHYFLRPAYLSTYAPYVSPNRLPLPPTTTGLHVVPVAPSSHHGHLQHHQKWASTKRGIYVLAHVPTTANATTSNTSNSASTNQTDSVASSGTEDRDSSLTRYCTGLGAGPATTDSKRRGRALYHEFVV